MSTTTTSDSNSDFGNLLARVKQSRSLGLQFQSLGCQLIKLLSLDEHCYENSFDFVLNALLDIETENLEKALEDTWKTVVNISELFRRFRSDHLDYTVERKGFATTASPFHRFRFGHLDYTIELVEIINILAQGIPESSSRDLLIAILKICGINFHFCYFDEDAEDFYYSSGEPPEYPFCVSFEDRYTGHGDVDPIFEILNPELAASPGEFFISLNRLLEIEIDEWYSLEKISSNLLYTWNKELNADQIASKFEELNIKLQILEILVRSKKCITEFRRTFGELSEEEVHNVLCNLSLAIIAELSKLADDKILDDDGDIVGVIFDKGGKRLQINSDFSFTLTELPEASS